MGPAASAVSPAPLNTPLNSLPLYTELQITGKLNGYLADLNEQAENMFLELVKQMAARENVTEQLKVQNQMLWVHRMNNIRDRAMEAVNNDLIYA